MSKRVCKGRYWRAVRVAPILSCFALAACASSGAGGFLVLADPGKYQYYSCKQIAEARASRVRRQQELKDLIDKSEQGFGGALIGAVAYRSEYAAVNQELVVLDATARDKNCPAAPTRHSDSAIQ